MKGSRVNNESKRLSREESTKSYRFKFKTLNSKTSPAFPGVTLQVTLLVICVYN